MCQIIDTPSFLVSDSWGNFPIISILGINDQVLMAPVLQHLMNAVVGNTSAFYRNSLLLSLFEGELHVEPLKDVVVSASFRSNTVFTTGIAAAVESILDSVAEEVQGVVKQGVCNDIESLQHLGRLSFQQLFLPQVRILLQPCFGTVESILTNQ